ncbi:hypothetical protein JIG36_03070 [Actinoplanes sp. LDG1-06]|uniref:Uncharacterized protein n=1 Tax=Paractinoplanes ovalisporus TaxID=2810368 RepID=A0ABS2A3V8_9ACTN|nr:hypothetical protein [Actinoplanes ovalisporus]MBM2614535.1 hypothetical protein [Actinoplanes ovalisporus]
MVTGEKRSAMLLRLLTHLFTVLAGRFRPAVVVESIEEAAQPVPADRSRVLRAQFTTGVRASRAPPFASA